MSLPVQILLGSIFLGLSSLIHILVLVATVQLLQKIGPHLSHWQHGQNWALLSAISFVAVVFAHTIQVWMWAIAFVFADALPTISQAIYFSLVTYTTVGYGDVTVDDGHRVFAAMAAVTGLLTFGLSTAFLVGLMTRFLPTNVD